MVEMFNNNPLGGKFLFIGFGFAILAILFSKPREIQSWSGFKFASLILTIINLLGLAV